MKIKSNDNKYIRLLSDTIVFAVGNLLVKLLQFFLVPLYTSVMSTAEFGVSELSNNLSEMIYPIITMGIYSALFRFALEKEHDRKKLFTNGILILSCGLAAAIAFGAIAYKFSDYSYTWQLVSVFCTNSIYMVVLYYSYGTAGSRRYVEGAVLKIIGLCLFNIYLLVYLRSGTNGYLFSIAASDIIAAAYLFIRSHMWRDFSVSKIDKQELKLLLKFGVPMMFNNMAWWLTSMPGRYIVLSCCGESEAGILAAVSKLPAVVTVFATTFQQAWQISSSKEYTSEDSNQFYSNVYKMYVSIVMTVTSVMICATPIISSIMLRGEFESAQKYLPLLLTAALIHCISVYFGTIYVAFKDTKMIMISTLFGAGANLIICFALIPVIGIWGSAIGGCAGNLIITLIRIVNSRRYMKIEMFPKLVVPSAVLLVIQTVLMSFDNNLFTVFSVISCILLVVINCKTLLHGVKETFEKIKANH